MEMTGALTLAGAAMNPLLFADRATCQPWEVKAHVTDDMSVSAEQHLLVKLHV